MDATAKLHCLSWPVRRMGAACLMLIMLAVVSVLLCATPAHALSTSTKPFDLSGDAVELQGGGTVSISPETLPIKSEWEEYGWKLSIEDDDNDGKGDYYLLTLADGFKFDGSGEFAIKMRAPETLVGQSQPSVIRFEGGATISLTSTSALSDSSAAIVVEGNHATSIVGSNDSSKSVVLDAGDRDYGIKSKQALTINGADIEAVGSRAGVWTEEGDLSVSNGQLTATGTGNGSAGVLAGAGITVGPQGSIDATGTGLGSRGVDTQGNVELTVASSLKAQGSSYGLKVGDFASQSTSKLTVGDGCSLIATSTMHASEETAHGVGVGRGGVELGEDAKLEASATSGQTKPGAATIRTSGPVKMGETSSLTIKGTRVGGLVANSLETGIGSVLTTEVEAPSATGIDIAGKAVIQGSTITSSMKGSGTNAFAIAGGTGAMVVEDSTLSLSAEGDNTVGLLLQENLLSSARSSLHIESSELSVSGEKAAVLAMQSGNHAADSLAITLGDNMVVSGGTAASVFASEAANPLTYWAYSPTGELRSDEAGNITGASTSINMAHNPAYYLSVDDQVLVATNDPDTLADVKISGVALFTAATRTLSLHGAETSDGAENVDPSTLPSLKNIVARGFGTSASDPLTIATTQAFAIVPEGDNPGPAISVQGPVRFAGTSESELVVVGRIETAPDSAGNAGALTLASGRVLVTGLVGNEPAVKTGAAQDAHDAHVALTGGLLEVQAPEQDTALNVDGNLVIEASAAGGYDQLLTAVGKQGAEVAGALRQLAGMTSVTGSDGGGLVARNVKGETAGVSVSGGLLDATGAFGVQSGIVQVDGVGVLNAIGFGDTSGTAGSGTLQRAGMYADTVLVSGGVVNAFGLVPPASEGVPQGNDEAYGMYATREVNVTGGIVTALAKTTDTGTTATGIYADALRAGGGTVTAYAYPGAAQRASIVWGTTGSTIQQGINIAAGNSAPGTQVSASVELAGYPYAYLTNEDLYLENDHLKWDYLDTEAILTATAFDPPNGELKVSKHMMASIVGLNSAVFLLSDGVDFSQDGFLASLEYARTKSSELYPDGDRLFFSPMLKGQGTALVFEHGELFAKQSLHTVADVEVFDFGSRYNTQPELAGLSALVPEGQQLVHSVHFNYEGEMPADVTVLMTVGDGWASKPVSWMYSDQQFSELTPLIVGQIVNPFGALESTGMQGLWHETAIMTNASSSADPGGSGDPNASAMKRLAPTGDGLASVVWALGGLLAASVVAAGCALRRARRI